jgi:hypothetical protein
MAVTITAKGDLIAGTGNATYDNLAAGSNGDTLVADSSSSTGLRYQGSMAAGRNFVINGGMDIWQRATSKLDGANGYHTADRWLLSSAAAQTFSRQTTSDTTNLPFIQYCMRVQRTSGSTDTSAGNISQSFETVNSIPLAGKTVTLSFYARKGANYSATSSILKAELFTGTGTDQNVYTVGYTGSVKIIDQNATLTTTWQRFSYTATLATNTTEIGLIFLSTPTGTAGAADFYEITGIQLEVGSVATQFSRAGGTIQGETALCQRYYWRPQNTTAFAPYAVGQCYGTSNVLAFVQNPVPMRVAATSVDYSNLAVTQANSTSQGLTSITLGNNSNFMNTLVITTSAANMVTGNATSLVNNNNTAGYLAFNAEL